MRFTIDVNGDNRITLQKIRDAQKMLAIFAESIERIERTGASAVTSLSMAGNDSGRPFHVASFPQGVRLKYYKGLKK